MNKEYTVKHTETLCNFIRVKAKSEEEAFEKAREIVNSIGYEGCENFEEEKFDIESSKIIDGKKLEQGYIPEFDATVIIEFTYKDGNLIGEQIVGYYHGEPYGDGIKDYAYKGTYVNHAIFG